MGDEYNQLTPEQLRERIGNLETDVDRCARHIVRPDDFDAVAPYIRNWPNDRKPAKIVLRSLEYHQREVGWAQHYFFEPLGIIRSKIATKNSYFLFNRIANELERELQWTQGDKKNTDQRPHFTLAQIEAVVNALARKPEQYVRAFEAIRRHGTATLLRLRLDLNMPEAFSAYAAEIRDSLRAYKQLDAASLQVLRLRQREANDVAGTLDQLLAEGKLPDPTGTIRQLHANIKKLEGERNPQRPVNLRWFSSLPADVETFINYYR